MVEKFGWQKKKEKMTYCYTVSNRGRKLMWNGRITGTDIF